MVSPTPPTHFGTLAGHCESRLVLYRGDNLRRADRDARVRIPSPVFADKCTMKIDHSTYRTLQRELDTYNDRLDSSLRSRYGMTFRTFKLIKAVTQMVGVGAAIYAMTLGAPPLAALAMATVMVSGPEVLEILVEGQEEN